MSRKYLRSGLVKSTMLVFWAEMVAESAKKNFSGKGIAGEQHTGGIRRTEQPRLYRPTRFLRAERFFFRDWTFGIRGFSAVNGFLQGRLRQLAVCGLQVSKFMRFPYEEVILLHTLAWDSLAGYGEDAGSACVLPQSAAAPYRHGPDPIRVRGQSSARPRGCILLTSRLPKLRAHAAEECLPA